MADLPLLVGVAALPYVRLTSCPAEIHLDVRAVWWRGLCFLDLHRLVTAIVSSYFISLHYLTVHM